MKNSVLCVIVAALLVVSASAFEDGTAVVKIVQTPTECEGDGPGDFRIAHDMPTVYLTYEGRGRVRNLLDAKMLEIPAEQQSSSGNRDVLLRLHNNSCWAVSFETHSMYASKPPEWVPLPNGNRVLAIPDDAEIGVYYEVREANGKRLPIGGPDMIFRSWLPAGRSIVFAVQKSHLKRKRVVSVTFEFVWEEGQSYSYRLAPIHRVEFDSARLPYVDGVRR
jgi:hypothetical protein